MKEEFMRESWYTRVGSAVRYGLGVLVIANAVAPSLMASSVPVPEIDATSLSAGLGLLAGGVLVLRARRRRK